MSVIVNIGMITGWMMRDKPDVRNEALLKELMETPGVYDLWIKGNLSRFYAREKFRGENKVDMEKLYDVRYFPEY